MADQESRLRRLEESVGFVEHQNEQISAEVLELGRLVAALGKRVDRLEARLEAMAEDDDASDGGDAG